MTFLAPFFLFHLTYFLLNWPAKKKPAPHKAGRELRG
jgi:hypothetical protein